MAIKGYLTPQDVVDALSEPTYMSIFDDTNSGSRSAVDVSSGVVSLMSRAHARCIATLPRIYSQFPPESPAGIPQGGDSIPILLKDLEVQLFVIYACMRHPELTKTYGINPLSMKEWRELANDIATAALIIAPTDSPPQANPANVGGVVDSGLSGADSSTSAAGGPMRYFADGTSDF
jgi:hypothetical protein